jgi:hypothetical protein
MSSKILLLLIIVASLCLLISPMAALMQSQSPDFHLDLFDPSGQTMPPQAPQQPETLQLQAVDQSGQPMAIAPIDLSDPKPAAYRTSAQTGDAPAAASDMRISQVYTHGGEAGATYLNDYIEIFNAGSTTVNINGWGFFVSTFEGTTNSFYGARYTTNNLVTPGMHLLVRFAGTGSNGQALTGLLPTVNDVSLGSTSGYVLLFSPTQTPPTSTCPASVGPNGVVSDMVGYGATACSEGSAATAPPANKSITRINGNCTDTDNNSSDFTVTAPNPRNIEAAATPCGGAQPSPTPTATPTPSASPSPTVSPTSGTIRISQVYTRGGEAGATYDSDFVELFNPGNTAIDINNWIISVKTLEGSTASSINLQVGQSFSMTPGMHILLPFNGTGGNGQALPASLLSPINIPLGSTSGQVVLLSPGQAIPSGCPSSGAYVDGIGWGSSTCFEGAPATVPASNKSMTRINGGCTDTNNNASDFAAADPNPRTFQSPLTPCGGVQPTPSPSSSPTATATPSFSPSVSPSPNASPSPSPVIDQFGFTFSAPAYEVWEGPTGLVITVIRSVPPNNAAGTVTVDYATSDGTAIAPNRYTATSGTLTFGANELIKSFKIPVNDDNIPEPDQTFNVTLSNPVGLGLGQYTTTTVTIHDNDAPLPTNPRIRISQVYPGGGEPGATFQRDFIELFNADTTAVNIQGWSIIITGFDSSGNPTSQGGTITSSINLQPGQHVILSMPGTGTNGQALNAEFKIETVSLASSGGQVFLIPNGKLVLPFTCPSTAPDPRGEVADFVAYGVGTCSAGGVAPAPPSNKSLTRVGGGCTNTYINSADFALTDPNPHFFASPPTTACGAANNSTIQFAAAQSNVSEGAGSTTITVNRTGDLSSVATVDYSTTDGTANERSDYARSAGTLTFGAGESQKTFDILITDDNIQEPTETVLLNLSRPSGNGTLGAQSSATLFILDNDSSTGTSNPIDSSAFYVDDHYHDFLNRVPDASGLQFWINGIESCGTDLTCRDIKRTDTSAAFFLSIEFQNTGFEVYRAYKAAFPDSAERPRGMVRYREFLRDTEGISRGVIVGNPGWEALLEANKVAFFQKFVANPEYIARYPRTMSAADFVDAVNANSGGVLSATERNDLVNGLLQLKETRATVLRKVAENPNFSTAEFSKAFVLMQYFGYLRRNVDDPPDKDFSGFDFWLNKLNQFNGDYRAAEMVRSFIVSDEFRKRFGSK